MLQLNVDVCACVANGRTALLDLRSDRYFGLPPKLDEAFQKYLGGSLMTPVDENTLRPLLNSGILTDSVAANPKRSSPEVICSGDVLLHPSTGLKPLDVWVAIGCYIWAFHMVRRRSLKRIVANIQSQRSTLNPPRLSRAWTIDEWTAAFSRIRRYLTTQDLCLVWSIAMLKFLALKGFDCTLVIGVRHPPFAAHAWVQAEDIVLSCSLEEARLYTPILVV